MTEKRFTLRLHPKDNGVKIFNNHDEDNWRVLNLHFDDYEDAKFVREKLEPVVACLNEQHETIERLKQNINELLSVDIEEQLLKENEQLKTKNNAYIQDIEVFKEENTHLKLENEELKLQLIEKERMLDVRDKIIADVSKAINGDLE